MGAGVGGGREYLISPGVVREGLPEKVTTNWDLNAWLVG